MPNQGGRYQRRRDGERTLVERTQPASERSQKPSAKPLAKVDSKHAAKSAPKQSDDVKEQDNG